jgi:voltage-gated potassium channel Kch
MISQLLVAWVLMALTVMIHATGVSFALRRPRIVVTRLWPRTRLFIRLAAFIIFLHLLEISIWGVFYVWAGAMTELPSSLYFSAVTYTTTGYGDLVLPMDWRLVGAVEALTGILMCGWSTGFFFAMVNQMLTSAMKRPERSL